MTSIYKPFPADGTVEEQERWHLIVSLLGFYPAPFTEPRRSVRVFRVPTLEELI